ncbi:MAG: hypothetical protein DHS20C11_27900 [Lysobacteraceae bacterium]|nr:MAG: hypothetical protein DHS20C11_27900 [Xanthomonadaceae bacterium]
MGGDHASVSDSHVDTAASTAKATGCFRPFKAGFVRVGNDIAGHRSTKAGY